MPSAAELARRTPSAPLRWAPAHRLIATRFPPIDLFERVADPADWEALYELESLTNPRLREQTGEFARVAPEDRVSGPGASIVMAPFTHLGVQGGRFSDEFAGAFYAADTLETAIAETRHHRARFLAATREPPIEIDVRGYLVDVEGRFHELRGRRGAADWRAVYDPDSYAASQAFARALRELGSDGVSYDSVRHAGGACLAAFRPRLVSNVRQSRHLRYAWNGREIHAVYELRLLTS